MGGRLLLCTVQQTEAAWFAFPHCTYGCLCLLMRGLSAMVAFCFRYVYSLGLSSLFVTISIYAEAFVELGFNTVLILACEVMKL